MATPTTKAEFKEYCLRKLGKPVIEINVDDDQVDDRIDEAIRYWYDYHFDGSDRIYYKHQVTADDKVTSILLCQRISLAQFESSKLAIHRFVLTTFSIFVIRLLSTTSIH